MRKVLFFLFVSVITATTISAQQIAVVSANGTTATYESLDEALTEAEDGSVVYLPGGGFSVKNETKITKKLTILGVSHRADTDNADGATMINGNLNFEGGSDGSALMGGYLSGNVNIGTSETSVQNILVKYCNINSVYVKNSLCLGIVINQNYIRKSSTFGHSSATITNNIMGGSIYNVSNGTVKNNIIFNQMGSSSASSFTSNSIIANNIMIGFKAMDAFDCQVSRNMLANRFWGDECINLPEGTQWTDVFVNSSPGVSIQSDFHFKEAYQQYSDIGIYGGTGFNDEALAPVPRIVSKNIPQQTDTSGKLSINVQVKAK